MQQVDRRMTFCVCRRMQLTSIALFGGKGEGLPPTAKRSHARCPCPAGPVSDRILSPHATICRQDTSLSHGRHLKRSALFCRVEQLRLLSKAEQAGLLTLAEKAGLTLGFIERSGLLSKAEGLGLLSLATDRCAPADQCCCFCLL